MMIHDHPHLLDKRLYLDTVSRQNGNTEDNDPILRDLESVSKPEFFISLVSKMKSTKCFFECSVVMTSFSVMNRRG